MELTSWLKVTLEKQLEQQDQWTHLCQGLLEEQDEKKDILVDQTSFDFLKTQTDKALEENGLFAAGAIRRPYYRAMAKTLQDCLDNGGPLLLLQDPLHLLSSKNSERVEQIQVKLASLSYDASFTDMRTFLFEYLTPEEWRLWLMMRTTTGSRDCMPPSLDECLIGFTTLYQKQNPKKTNHHVLTVGAKALSKHCHRDRQVGFWGDCNGSEPTKNMSANKVLMKILTNTVWINLHSLPHDHIVYEIRQGQGYGARWTRDMSHPSNAWFFRGFLEPQMVDGHSRGWVH
ncbi:hypothetical protein BC941DRAFT_445115 [Chlamydoabsidia padenii]|nr:hypothetical protein BC941DRAFT_445115 [Chlamydoabsidia padenii]